MSTGFNRLVIWIAAVLAVVILAAVSAVGVSAAVLPGCESCHLKGPFGAETKAGPHASVRCADCHVDDTFTGRVGFGTRQVFHMVIPLVPELDRSYSEVPRERCLSCHEDVQGSQVVGTRGLRIKHAQCAAGALCTDCHSVTAHGAATRWPRTSQMEACYRCHGVTNKVVACDSCHDRREEREIVSSGAFRVTHGDEWKATHGMGDMDSCQACHDSDKCGKCHGVGVPHTRNFLGTHATFSVDPKAKCMDCHVEKFCSDCHAYPMPHSVEFVMDHGPTVDKDGERKCLTCHVKNDCDQCHVDHVHPVTLEQMQGDMLRDPRSSDGGR